MFGQDNGGGLPPRKMYPANCSDCGKDTEVPFPPAPGRAVRCQDCYRKFRDANPRPSRGGFGGPRRDYR